MRKPYIYLTGTDEQGINEIVAAMSPDFGVVESDRENPVASRLRIKAARAVLYFRTEPDEIAAMEMALAHEWDVPVFVVGPGVIPGAYLHPWMQYHSTASSRYPETFLYSEMKKALLLPHEQEEGFNFAGGYSLGGSIELNTPADVISTALGNGVMALHGERLGDINAFSRMVNTTLRYNQTTGEVHTPGNAGITGNDPSHIRIGGVDIKGIEDASTPNCYSKL